MRKTTMKIVIASAAILGCASIVAFFAPQQSANATLPTTFNSTPTAPQGHIDLTGAAECAVHSVVHVKVLTRSKTKTYVQQDPFGGLFGDIFGRGGGMQRREIQTPPRASSGSGVIISTDGYIVTNNHVVSDADEVSVKLNDNREFQARVIGLDESTDLALLKIEETNLPTIPIGNSDHLKLGEWVLAVGNPFNLTSTVTAGIVSAKARSLGANGVESFIQTDAAINQGNSGGALVNARGELVGINAMLYSQTGSYSGYGFAIPTSIMNKVVSDLKTYGIVQRVFLGIEGSDVGSYLDAQKAQNKSLDLGTVDGVYIGKVNANGAAAEAGLEAGDVIIAIDGKRITKFSELHEILATHSPGQEIAVTYLRDKKSHTRKMTLKNERGTTNVVTNDLQTVLGGTFTPISHETKQKLNLPYGLQVESLKGGKLKEQGVQKDFIIFKVNNQPMRSIADLEDAIKAANESEDRMLWIICIDTRSVIRPIGIYLGE